MRAAHTLRHSAWTCRPSIAYVRTACPITLACVTVANNGWANQVTAWTRRSEYLMRCLHGRESYLLYWCSSRFLMAPPVTGLFMIAWGHLHLTAHTCLPTYAKGPAYPSGSAFFSPCASLSETFRTVSAMSVHSRTVLTTGCNLQIMLRLEQYGLHTWLLSACSWITLSSGLHVSHTHAVSRYSTTIIRPHHVYHMGTHTRSVARNNEKNHQKAHCKMVNIITTVFLGRSLHMFRIVRNSARIVTHVPGLGAECREFTSCRPVSSSLHWPVLRLAHYNSCLACLRALQHQYAARALSIPYVAPTSWVSNVVISLLHTAHGSPTARSPAGTVNSPPPACY